MTEKALERVTMESHLRQSLQKNEMQVYYQVQVDARDDHLIGMEALLRWHHPQMGLISPDKFIPLAEDTGFIVELDEWVMREALTQFKQWYDKGFNPGVVALNLSLLRLEQKDFIKRVKGIMQECDADVSWVTFEVTEGQIMHNPYEAIKILRVKMPR